MFTIVEYLVKIDPVFSDIFGEICQILSVVSKIQICHLVMSGVNGPIFIKFI